MMMAMSSLFLLLATAATIPLKPIMHFSLFKIPPLFRIFKSLEIFSHISLKMYTIFSH